MRGWLDSGYSDGCSAAPKCIPYSVRGGVEKRRGFQLGTEMSIKSRMSPSLSITDVPKSLFSTVMSPLPINSTNSAYFFNHRNRNLICTPPTSWSIFDFLLCSLCNRKELPG